MTHYSPIQRRIKQLAFDKQISINSLEKLCGLSQGYVKSIHNAIPSDKAGKIAKAYPDVNMEWLLYGEGEMYKSHTPTIYVGGPIQSNGDNGININGDRNIIPAIDRQREIAALQDKVRLLERLLEEKERTIIAQQRLLDVLAHTK